MFSSKIEKLICSNEFLYLSPYFYTNPYALRCKLGTGENNVEYKTNATMRAMEIYNILFQQKADAIIFDYWIYDYSDNGDIFYDEEELDEINNYILENEMAKLKFVLQYQSEYRHKSIKNLETYNDEDSENERRNRIICYADNKSFDYQNLIINQIEEEVPCKCSFVSFKNECIFSVYDDRGCDIVFATQEKMKEFYPKLEQYFLEYDLEEMKRRFDS